VNLGYRSLRAHDVHQGLQFAGIDRSSGIVGQQLEATQYIGMAAALATAIKGIDVIDGAQLKQVADYQLDIPTFGFDRVVGILEELEYVRNVTRDSAGRIRQLYETVPENFSRLYESLDEAYARHDPGEIESSLITTIDDLSRGPRPVGDLDIDPHARSAVLELGDAAEAIKVVTIRGEPVAHSPYFAYEHPELVSDALSELDLAQVRAAFERVRGHQGERVGGGPNDVLNQLIAAGLMAGPSVANPNGIVVPFAVAPYGLPPDLLTVRKGLLDKAMAILASVRMGETEGGLTNLVYPQAFLRGLRDSDRVVGRHSSTQRQYSVLRQMGIVRFVGSGERKGMQLIDTDDNKAAVDIALDFLKFGEATKTKQARADAADATIDAAGNYRSPIQAIRPARRRAGQVRMTFADLIESAMGRRPVE